MMDADNEEKKLTGIMTMFHDLDMMAGNWARPTGSVAFRTWHVCIDGTTRLVG